MKRTQYYILGLLVHAGLFTSTALPERVFTSFCTGLSRFCFLFFRRYRKRIAGNLRMAFGPAGDRKQLSGIRKAVATNIGLNVAETICSATGNKDRVLSRITLHGAENIDRALAGGRGVIAVSAHMGNFMLMSAKMIQLGYSFTMLVKESRHTFLADAIRVVQQKQGGSFIYLKPWRQALQQILGCLKRNEIVCLLADENKRRSGTVVDFFNHPAPTAIGPAVLSLRSGAALLPVFIVRDGNGMQHIYAEPHLEPDLDGTRDQKTHAITDAYTRVIEKYVRDYPEQWFWFNNRWKKAKTGEHRNPAGRRIRKRRKRHMGASSPCRPEEQE